MNSRNPAARICVLPQSLVSPGNLPPPATHYFLSRYARAPTHTHTPTSTHAHTHTPPPPTPTHPNPNPPLSQDLLDRPHGTVCDVIGLLCFVGRAERIRNKGEALSGQPSRLLACGVPSAVCVFCGRRPRGGAFGVPLAATGGRFERGAAHGEALLHVPA